MRSDLGKVAPQPIIINSTNKVLKILEAAQYTLNPITESFIIERLDWKKIIDKPKEHDDYGIICILKLKDKRDNAPRYILSDNPVALKQFSEQLIENHGGLRAWVIYNMIFDGTIFNIAKDEDIE